jgi:hypothetical protein
MQPYEHLSSLVDQRIETFLAERRHDRLVAGARRAPGPWRRLGDRLGLALIRLGQRLHQPEPVGADDPACPVRHAV